MNLQPILRAAAKISLCFAKLGAGTASSFNRYQPKLPAFFRNKK